MSLTAQQIVDTRRYMGFSVSGSSASQPYREPVYSNASLASLSLDYRLANLSAEEENTVTTYYLPNLAAREQDIQCAASKTGTAEAGPWKRNPYQIAELRDLYNQLRRDLCDFLGFAPGHNLTAGNRVVRA